MESKKLEVLLQSLLEGNKLAKRTALRELNGFTMEVLNSGERDLHSLYAKVGTALFSALSDKSEINRTEATMLLCLFIENNCIREKGLCTLISIMHHRIGKVPITEDSEDVKLELLKALKLILKNDVSIMQYLTDIVDILALCLLEKCADILLVSCECVNNLSASGKVKFHMQSECLVKPLVKCLSHQRFKIRCKVLETIGNVLIHGDAACFEKLTESLGLCVKDIPQVRLQLVNLGHRLATEFSERYSYWPKILPLILFGLKDADNEVKAYTTKCWTEVGAQYERENEEVDQDIKFYMPKENFIDEEHQFGIGCQLLVQKSLSYLIPCIALSIDDWQLDTRLRATQLLTALIINGQESIVQYSNKILPTICRAANDMDKDVSDEALIACKYFGFFVSPKIYLQILDHQLSNEMSYRVLLSLLSVTNAEVLQEYLPETLELLQFNEFNFNSDFCIPIVGIITLLANSCQVDSVCHQLLLPLLYFSSCGELSGDACVKAMEKLAKKCKHSDISAMISTHSESVMKEIEKSANIWDRYSIQLVIFISLSRFGGLESNLESLGNICSSIMNRKDCPIIQYKFIESVQNFMLTQKYPINDDVEKWIAKFVSEHLNKLLPWTPGKTAEALRTATVSFLLSMTLPSENSSVLCQALRTSLTFIPQLITDESEDTRHLTCKFIQLICKNRNIRLDNKILLSFAEILIKRLDDKKRQVRLIASETLPVTFKLDTASMGEVTYMVENHIKSILIYLDEDDAQIRKNIFDALRTAGEMCPQYLLKTLQENGHNFRNEDLCKQLSSELSVLTIN